MDSSSPGSAQRVQFKFHPASRAVEGSPKQEAARCSWRYSSRDGRPKATSAPLVCISRSAGLSMRPMSCRFGTLRVRSVPDDHQQLLQGCWWHHHCLRRDRQGTVQQCQEPEVGEIDERSAVWANKFLVRNKCDLAPKTVVPTDEAKELGESLNIRLQTRWQCRRANDFNDVDSLSDLLD